MIDPDAYYAADEDRPGYEPPDPRPGEDDANSGETLECECCGSAPGCGCEIDDVSGDCPESGPWSYSLCHTHLRCV